MGLDQLSMLIGRLSENVQAASENILTLTAEVKSIVVSQLRFEEKQAAMSKEISDLRHDRNNRVQIAEIRLDKHEKRIDALETGDRRRLGWKTWGSIGAISLTPAAAASWWDVIWKILTQHFH